jgi:hypothetical protein
MGSSQIIHDLGPDTCPPPANKAVVAGGVGPKSSGMPRHGAPDRNPQKMSLRTRRSFTRGTPRGFFGSIGLMAVHSCVTMGKFVAHGSSPRFRGLNHDPRAGLNEPSFVAVYVPKVAFGQTGHQPAGKTGGFGRE